MFNDPNVVYLCYNCGFNNQNVAIINNEMINCNCFFLITVKPVLCGT